MEAALGAASARGIASFQEQIEWHLRILSLRVGFAVGVLSLIGPVFARGFAGGGQDARATFNAPPKFPD